MRRTSAGVNPVRRLGTMQAQVSPAAGDQRGPQLVAEAERRHDVAIPGKVRSSKPRVAESSVGTWLGSSGQRLELVDVVLAELIVEELIRHTYQRPPRRISR